MLIQKKDVLIQKYLNKRKEVLLQMTITVHKTKSRPVFDITANDNINCFFVQSKIRAYKRSKFSFDVRSC